jgi:hypothetical protein
MILVDLDESYQNILKSSQIARKRVPLLWGQKSCFFSFAPKRYFSQEKEEPYITAIQLVKRYQNHHHMTLHDHPFVKKWGVKNFIFSDFGYFKGITGVICNGIKR